MDVKIGRALDHYRKLRGISQEAIAASAGMTQPNLSRLLRGTQEISVSQLDALARAVGVKTSAVVLFAESATDDTLSRWHQLYDQLSPAQRAAAIDLLTPPDTGKKSRNSAG
jgi:transcriptional regulator with XRE-family HTH domain